MEKRNQEMNPVPNGKSQDKKSIGKNIEKNQLAEVVIQDMTENGEGIGKLDGYTLFIKDTVIGDRVLVKIIKAKKTYGYARLMEILTPSADRTEPRCPAAGPCGGCQLQSMTYEAQLAFKRKKVEDHLRRIGGFSDITVEPVIGMKEPWCYRNKAQFPVGRDRDGKIRIGFYAGRTHSIIETERCYLGRPVNEQVLAIVRTWMNRQKIVPYDETTGKGLIRHVLIREGRATGQVMVCLVINGKKLPAAEMLVQELKDIHGMTSISYNINMEQTNVILGRQVVTLWGEDTIEDQIGGISFRISPLSFYQVNPEQTERLYGKALEFAGLTGGENVWDLYCGIGTISLFLAQKAGKVHGVEIIPAAIENARENAERNGFTNTEFFVGKAEEVLPQWYREHGEKADVIVVDPPRKGCDPALLDVMLQMDPERIVYVSCDSATLARDLKILTGENRYQIKTIQPVDMFPQSIHVETVVLLSKLNTKQHIEVELNLDELDLTSAESKATYDEIKAYVLEKHGLKVSSLYISQVKRKYGLDVGQNYNLSKKEDAKVPQCPPEKEAAIMDALKHFQMI